MKVVTLTPPGRFPTVVFDPGLWWDSVTASGGHQLIRFSANFTWWRTLCGGAAKKAFLAPLTIPQSLRQRAVWRAMDIDLVGGANAAGGSLAALCEAETYASADAYVGAVTPLARYLGDLDAAQEELSFGIDFGVRVGDLNYADSAQLVNYAGRETVLSRLIDGALETCPADIGFLAVGVTSPEDLLTAMIAVNRLRPGNPGMHACLADHGYENFSLHAHMEALRGAGTLDTVFDSIIESKDERDLLLPALIETVAVGGGPRGFLTGTDFPDLLPSPPSPPSPPPPLPTFSPEPVQWTRLSKRRCYWSRCAFCAQNTKYDDPKAPSHAEIPHSLDRVAAHVAAGYRIFIFSDEAISPAALGHLTAGIGERDLDFRWACRCKMETAHSADLFARMGAAGCYEVLFGLESTSPRVLQRMDKYIKGMDDAAVDRVFHDMDAAGIGVHVNLIGGFPGDTPGETGASVDFLLDSLADLSGATYILNAFALFPDTPVLNDPDTFGLSPVAAVGDMPSSHDFALAPDIEADTKAVFADVPRLREKLSAGLGWNRFGTDEGARTALALYFGSGHGSIFKARPDNPFANPLREAVP
jgi:hypothetical protein